MFGVSAHRRLSLLVQWHRPVAQFGNARWSLNTQDFACNSPPYLSKPTYAINLEVRAALFTRTTVLNFHLNPSAKITNYEIRNISDCKWHFYGWKWYITPYHTHHNLSIATEENNSIQTLILCLQPPGGVCQQDPDSDILVYVQEDFLH